MDPVLRALYGAAGQLARIGAALAPPGNSKLLKTLAARRGIRERYRRWGVSGRNMARPLLWMHAPSVGEGLQARPVLELARSERPDVQLAYTFFSPSAARFATGLGADFTDYLPFDTAGDARVVIESLRPSALVFSKLDVWPVLTEVASQRGIPLGLISATLSAGSSRDSGFAARALRAAYARLDRVGAIDQADADRLTLLGVRADRVQVTGDTRFDQVWARASRVDRGSPVLRPLASARPTVVAGSTWPSDEAVLLPAFRVLRATHRNARLILAPHEPTESHLGPIERWGGDVDDASLRVRRLSAADAGEADVVLVDRVGVLGELYALADIAYVGGGFHGAGLHSVLEPAAYGAPVLFGPRHSRSRDARLLRECGGGVSVAGEAELIERVSAWLRSERERTTAGAAARTMVFSGLGAARRSFELVSALLRPCI